jgi:hypothetical protein
VAAGSKSAAMLKPGFVYFQTEKHNETIGCSTAHYFGCARSLRRNTKPYAESFAS